MEAERAERENGAAPGLSPAGIALVCAILLALLALTIAAGRLHWGPWNLVLAMAIATAKLILIALYFMRLRYGGGTYWVFAGAGFFWLLILAGLSLADFLTRRGAY